jgi:hypothetical protein
LSAAQLEILVSRVALYPDDLLALVLPASTQPLEVVEAQRFLEQRKANASMQPSKEWDPSIIALLNYPEALKLMTADVTWLTQLGTSMVYQQAAVMGAVQSFRRKVMEAGNLKTNDKQTVSADSSTPPIIVIESTNPQVIYVPVYEPTTVVYAAPSPTYYSAPYPYYYDPYAPYYMGGLLGVSIGFGFAWYDDDIDCDDIDPDEVRQRVQERQQHREERRQERQDNRNPASPTPTRRNPENAWRPDQSGVTRAQSELRGREQARGAVAAAPAARAANAAPPASRQDLAERAPRPDVGGDRSVSPGAFSGVDRGAAASRYSARGAGSMGGGFGGGRGGGFGGGRGGGGRR